MENLSFTIVGKGPEGAKIIVSKGDRYLATITIRKGERRWAEGPHYVVYFEEYPVFRFKISRDLFNLDNPRELRRLAEDFFHLYYRRIPERGDLISRIIGGE
jgi:hypothetical protein